MRGGEDLAVGEAIDDHVIGGTVVQLGEERSGLRQRVLPVPRPRRVGRPSDEGQGRVQRAQATELHLQVGGLQHDRQRRVGQRGHRGEHVGQLVGLVRPLLAGVADQDDIARTGAQSGVLEARHASHEPRLHIAGTPPDDQVALAPGLAVGIGRRHDVEVAHEQHRRTGIVEVARNDAVADASDGLIRCGVAVGEPRRDPVLVAGHVRHGQDVEQQRLEGGRVGSQRGAVAGTDHLRPPRHARGARRSGSSWCPSTPSAAR